jgi:hypothetical protein
LPESIGFSADLAEKLAFWMQFHRAFLTLWLNSGEYESWSRSQLERIDSPVNVRGLEAVAELNKHRRAFFWWFQGTTRESFLPVSTCPRCGGALVESFGKLVCNPCSVVVPNG